MSGHSKWSQIKRAKGAADVKRGQLFTKLGRELAIATREGGGNPEANARLRLAVERAREANMPSDTIQRAIQRALSGAEGSQLEEITYEGYGPSGAALLIQATTDNRNRTVAEVRAALSRGGGSLGEAGSVAWNFEARGIIIAEPARGQDAEDLALKAIDAGADDFVVEDGEVEILTAPTELDAVRRSLQDQQARIVSAELSMVPKTQVELPDDQVGTLMRLVERLEDLDDVTRVYTNVHVSEQALASLAS